MNQKEAAKVAEVLRVLEHGPGAGWTATLAGHVLGPWTPAELERAADVKLWLETWITADLAALVARYGAGK